MLSVLDDNAKDDASRWRGKEAAMSRTALTTETPFTSSGLFRRLSERLFRGWQGLEREYRFRMTIRTLQGLDDRMLRDIGVHRGDIESFVRCDCGATGKRTASAEPR